jgi:tRNA-dihydrouridine synthase
MPEPISGAALADLAAAHYEAILAQWGDELGLRVARKHIGWYLAGAGVADGSIRGALMTETRPAIALRLLRAALGGEGRLAAA